MKRFFITLFSLLFIWAAYIGFDGDAFTYYLAIGLILAGVTGLVITFNAERICALMEKHNAQYPDE